MVAARRPTGYSRFDDRHLPLMIGLSVAVGRFVEALFWAIARVAGSIAAVAVAGAIVLAVVAMLARRAWRKRRR